MISPNIKKFNNEISFYESKSTKKIPPDCYYIVHITLRGGDEATRMSMIPKLSESLLLSDPIPRSIYYTNFSIIMIFSSQTTKTSASAKSNISRITRPETSRRNAAFNFESSLKSVPDSPKGTYSPSEESSDGNTKYQPQHQLEGFQHRIISKYVHSLTLETLECGCNIEAKVIYFQIPNHILGYIFKNCIENTNEEYIRLSKGMLTEDDIVGLTEIEIKDTLRNKCGVEWNNINSNDLFGSIIKYKHTKKGEKILKTISEKLDYREHKRYNKFIID